MAIPFHAAFADLSLLTVFMFYIAASQSQHDVEQVALPISQEIQAAPVDELGSDVQILNLRLVESDVVWQGQVLAPSPSLRKFVFGSQSGCYDRYWKLADTAEMWPEGAPVLIRAGRNLPFKYVSKMFEVFTRDQLQSHDVYLAVAVEEK